MTMEVEIISARDNILLRRKDVKFRVKHAGEKTPERKKVIDELAKVGNINKNNIVIRYMKTVFGKPEVLGMAKFYHDVNDIKKIERPYITKRIHKKKEDKSKEES